MTLKKMTIGWGGGSNNQKTSRAVVGSVAQPNSAGCFKPNKVVLFP